MVLLCLGACRPERPKNVISPERMESILYDYHLAQTMGGDQSGDYLYRRRLMVDYVLQKYGITQAELDSSLVWYARYPENLKDIYKRLADRADRDVAYIQSRQDETPSRVPLPVPGDSVDIWYDYHLQMLSSLPMDNRRTFVFPSDSCFLPKDRFDWLFDVLFLTEPTDNPLAVASMYLRYSNDSVVAVDSILTTNGPAMIQLANSDEMPIREVYVGIHFKDSDENARLIVANNRLMRYHFPKPPVASVAPADSAAAVSDTTATDTLRHRHRIRRHRQRCPHP